MNRRPYQPKYAVPDFTAFSFLLLSLYDFEVDKNIWDNWSTEDQSRVYDYYADELYRASDNIITHPRRRPNFLPQEFPGRLLA